MNNNINSTRIKRSATRDEFYTTKETAESFVAPLGDKGFYAGKRLFCNCDGPESEIYKCLKKNFNKWQLAGLEACQYCEDGFGTHTTYNQEKDEDIIATLPDDGSFDSKSSHEILSRSDIVVTNPPFSKQDKFVSMLLSLDKKFLIICNMMNLMQKRTRSYAIDKKIKLITGFMGGLFVRPNGEEANVKVVAATNIDNIERFPEFNRAIPQMTKAQLLAKGVLNRPDGFPENHFEVRYIKYFPIDLPEDEIVWCPMTVLFVPWFMQHTTVQKDLLNAMNCITVDGKNRFHRIPLKLRQNK